MSQPFTREVLGNPRFTRGSPILRFVLTPTPESDAVGPGLPPIRALDGLLRLDQRLVALLTGLAEQPAVLNLLRLVSRLGDWGLSVTTGAVLAWCSGPAATGRFAAVSLVALAVQKALKVRVARVRPCLVAGGPPQLAPIPDAGSFPSGHTLHAVLAAAAMATAMPALAAVFVPVAGLMAVSRVALGVHYPSDVAAGGALGMAFASLI